MRLSFFAVLSSLAELPIVNAFSAKNLQLDDSSEGPCDGKSVFTSTNNASSPLWQVRRRGVLC